MQLAPAGDMDELITRKTKRAGNFARPNEAKKRGGGHLKKKPSELHSCFSEKALILRITGKGRNELLKGMLRRRECSTDERANERNARGNWDEKWEGKRTDWKQKGRESARI
ncbi:hypothetical protein niasHT_016010 [Heterodera trifolii]|uniref:Uncharacterized protein n=1 Tax=Heterodera trifolii TaxID=157864 RepID=A0ABD2LEU2_9BILA